jgi:hypothetical protein
MVQSGGQDNLELSDRFEKLSALAQARMMDL